MYEKGANVPVRLGNEFVHPTIKKNGWVTIFVEPPENG